MPVSAREDPRRPPRGHRSAHFCVAALVALVLAPGASAAEGDAPAVSLSSPVNVSRTPTFSQSPALACDRAGAVYVMWEEMGGYLLPFSRSTDDAHTFSDPTLVVPGAWDLSFGQIRLASGGNGELQAVFTSFDTYYGGAEIVHVASSDGGDTFPSPRVISTIDYFNSYVADVGVGWGVAAAWANTDLATESTVDFSVSEDAGATFSTPKRVDAPGGYRSSPVVSLYGDGEVYVAWVGNDDPLGASDAEEIYFSRSTDRGVTFSSPINVSSNSEKSWPPRMAVDDAGTIYLVWTEGDFIIDEKLLFAVSVDGGASFGEARVLAGPTAWVEGRIVAVGDGVIWVAWNEDASVAEPGQESYVTRSVDGGLAFSAPTPLPGLSEIASTSPARFFVAWSETPDAQEWPEVFVARGEIFTCGDADVDGSVTATDALFALQASVGAAECAACRCDVNAAGGVSATDALLILRAAVGDAVSLTCPAC